MINMGGQWIGDLLIDDKVISANCMTETIFTTVITINYYLLNIIRLSGRDILSHKPQLL
jgi:hypothetical protein